MFFELSLSRTQLNAVLLHVACFLTIFNKGYSESYLIQGNVNNYLVYGKKLPHIHLQKLK